MEALISIKWISSSGGGSWETNNGFSSFTAGTLYLVRNADDTWNLSSNSDDKEIIDAMFTRTIYIEDVLRLDGGKGDIDSTGTGETILDSNAVSKKITVQIGWFDYNGDTWQIVFTTYLMNWANPLIFSNI